MAQELGFAHIVSGRVYCILSQGSKTKRTIARIHGLPKALQVGAGLSPLYVIELVSEKFLRQSPEDRLRTLIHELMHVPHNFGGGFRHHKHYVSHRQVEEMYQQYVAHRQPA